MLQHISISWQKSYKDGLLLGQCEVGLNLKAWESAIPSLGRGREGFIRKTGSKEPLPATTLSIAPLPKEGI